MNKENEIERKVEAVMSSLDGMESASPRAFLHTRVQARLYREDKNIWNRLSVLVSRPAIAFSVVCLILLMNLLVLLQQKSTSPALADQAEQSAYDEFNSTANNFYDFAINEP